MVQEIAQRKLKQLMQVLDYQFQNIDHLQQALQHRSVGNNNNERLEFLGDSIINFLIADALYGCYPNAQEGVLTRMRARLVCGETLSEIAKQIELGDFLILGKGELRSGGHQRQSILADALEAILAAIYLDGGLESVKSVIKPWFEQRINTVSEANQRQKDPKTQLQELLQAKKLPLPVYEIIEVSGEPHDQLFVISCQIELLPEPIIAQGRNRRQAEQQAAQEVLMVLGKKL